MRNAVTPAQRPFGRDPRAAGHAGQLSSCVGAAGRRASSRGRRRPARGRGRSRCRRGRSPARRPGRPAPARPACRPRPAGRRRAGRSSPACLRSSQRKATNGLPLVQDRLGDRPRGLDGPRRCRLLVLGADDRDRRRRRRRRRGRDRPGPRRRAGRLRTRHPEAADRQRHGDHERGGEQRRWPSRARRASRAHRRPARRTAGRRWRRCRAAPARCRAASSGTCMLPIAIRTPSVAA